MNILPTGVDQDRISPYLTRPSHRGFEYFPNVKPVLDQG